MEAHAYAYYQMKSDREAFFYYKHLQNIKVDNKDKNQQSIFFSGFKEKKISFGMEAFFYYFTPAHQLRKSQRFEEEANLLFSCCKQ